MGGGVEVTVLVGVGVTLGTKVVAVGVGVSVGVDVMVGSEMVAVGVAVAVRLGVADGVAVGSRVGVRVRVATGVSVGMTTVGMGVSVTLLANQKKLCAADSQGAYTASSKSPLATLMVTLAGSLAG
ncbi:MAG: hypothetical protein A2Z04_05810, partial [Chloroflexi bacterium RBG_16_57_9]